MLTPDEAILVYVMLQQAQLPTPKAKLIGGALQQKCEPFVPQPPQQEIGRAHV